MVLPFLLTFAGSKCRETLIGGGVKYEGFMHTHPEAGSNEFSGLKTVGLLG